MKATIVFDKIWKAIHANNEDGTRKHRYIILTGSSRSSKTASTIQAIDQYCRSELNKRCTAWRDTKKDCKDTVLKDALTYMKMWGNYKQQQEFNKTESIFTYNTDSTFEIHGTDDEEKVMGLNKAVAWMNEPYKISQETFNQIDQRTEDFVIIDWNPKKNHWIDDIIKDERAIVIHSTFRDNPFCPIEQKRKILSYQSVKKSKLVTENILTEQEAQKYDLVTNPLNFTTKELNELIRCRANEDKRSANDFNWDVYGLGVKGERPHRIFRWEPISDEYYKALTYARYVGVDWGTVDPWGIVEAKYHDGNLYVHMLNYKSENEIRSELTPTELAQIMGVESEEHKTERTGLTVWRFNQLGISESDSVICDWNKPLKTVALRRAGYNAYPAVNKSIADGIRLLQNLNVYYTQSSIDLEYEQENYSWKLDSNGKPTDEAEDSNNHGIDPTRYIALHLLALGLIPPDMM